MYAVIFEQKLLYLGYNPLKALSVFRLKNNAELHHIESTCELEKLIHNENNEINFLNLEEINPVSERVSDLFKKLEDIQDKNSKDDHIQKKSTTVSAEVRYLGHKDMKPVGQGFVSVNGIMDCSEQEG